MKFIKVKNNKTGISYPWMADVTNTETLLVLEKWFSSRNAGMIMEFVSSKDFSCEGEDHYKPSNYIAPLLKALASNLKKGDIPAIVFSQTMDRIAGIRETFLIKYGRILISENGGYFQWTNDLETIEEKEANYFPQKINDIKVSRWPDCKHFYVVKGYGTLVLEGREKWNTEKEAWEAVERFKNGEKCLGY
ncbi:MAG: hypothetical protein M0P12_01215 [Paludibacteraceae bacterium]|nr:hypothetical protein [Paludibacteraceae bacterium]